MFKRSAFCNLSMQHIQPVFSFYAQRMCSNNSKDVSIFSHENANNILKMVNSKSSKYLTKFKISEQQVQALELHKEKHGRYKSIADVLNVEGINKDILNELINSFNHSMQSTKRQKAKKSVIFPIIQDISDKTTSTVLGIYVGTNVVTWTLLDREENILEWNYTSFSDIPENSSVLNLLEMVWRLNDMLPTSDVYVVNEQSHDHNVIKCMSHLRSYLQRQQLKAMILAFLKTRNSENHKLQRNIYLTLHEKVANLFGLRIGSEVTCSTAIISKLLHRKDDLSNKEKNPAGVYISKDIMYIYRSQLDYVRDQMNWSLLVAITFLQLGIHKKYNIQFI